MKIFIVKTDTAEKSEPAYWVIDKVFLTEHAAREYAEADVHRELEAHDVADAPLSIRGPGKPMIR